MRGSWNAYDDLSYATGSETRSPHCGSLLLRSAYTIWTGIGVVGAFVARIVYLGEPAWVMRIVAAGMTSLRTDAMKISPDT